MRRCPNRGLACFGCDKPPGLSWSGLSRPSICLRAPAPVARWILGTSPRMTNGETRRVGGAGPVGRAQRADRRHAVRRVSDARAPTLSWSGLSRPSICLRDPAPVARWILGTSPRMTKGRDAARGGAGARSMRRSRSRGLGCFGCRA